MVGTGIRGRKHFVRARLEIARPTVFHDVDGWRIAVPAGAVFAIVETEDDRR